jgi:hypothetical protein
LASLAKIEPIAGAEASYRDILMEFAEDLRQVHATECQENNDHSCQCAPV